MYLERYKTEEWSVIASIPISKEEKNQQNVWVCSGIRRLFLEEAAMRRAEGMHYRQPHHHNNRDLPKAKNIINCKYFQCQKVCITLQIYWRNNFSLIIKMSLLLKLITHFLPSSELMSLQELPFSARTTDNTINQRNLKFWADVTDKICFGCT